MERFLTHRKEGRLRPLRGAGAACGPHGPGAETQGLAGRPGCEDSAAVSIELVRQIECQAIEFIRQSFLADEGLE